MTTDQKASPHGRVPDRSGRPQAVKGQVTPGRNRTYDNKTAGQMGQRPDHRGQPPVQLIEDHTLVQGVAARRKSTIVTRTSRTVGTIPITIGAYKSNSERRRTSVQPTVTRLVLRRRMKTAVIRGYGNSPPEY
jgi:hypothetical protein